MNESPCTYLGQRDLADLSQLRLSEPDERVAGLVPEPVALAQVPELDADHAGEGGADEAAVEGSLGEAAREEVDVVHVLVGPPQPLDHGRRYLPAEVAEVVGSRQVADGPAREWPKRWALGCVNSPPKSFAESRNRVSVFFYHPCKGCSRGGRGRVRAAG